MIISLLWLLLSVFTPIDLLLHYVFQSVCSPTFCSASSFYMHAILIDIILFPVILFNHSQYHVNRRGTIQ